MGATAFRNKKTSRGQYKVRKNARLAGKPIKGRSHEAAPWYTFQTPGHGQPSPESPIARVERELAKFGERARYRDRFQAAQEESRRSPQGE